MQAWRIAKHAYALDRDGVGARACGGRWNSVGVSVIYAGMTAEIAAFEKLVHIGGILPADLSLVRLDLPEEPFLYRIYAPKDLPNGWDALPSSTWAAKCGDKFVAAGQHLGIIVPSAVMPEASNIVLNPAHPEFKRVRMEVVRKFEFDSRLRGS